MKYWMETVALPREQVQHTANVDILSFRGKMSAIIPPHGPLAVVSTGMGISKTTVFFCSRLQKRWWQLACTLLLNNCMNIFTDTVINSLTEVLTFKGTCGSSGAFYGNVFWCSFGAWCMRLYIRGVRIQCTKKRPEDFICWLCSPRFRVTATPCPSSFHF